MEDHGGDYGETSNGGAGHDDFQGQLSGMGTTEYDRQQVLQQQQQAALQAQQQAAFQQYQAALEARLMFQQQQQQQHQDSTGGEDGKEQDGKAQQGGADGGSQQSSLLAGGLLGGRADPGSLLSAMYPAPDLQGSELGSLIMLQDVSAGLLNNRALQQQQQEAVNANRQPRVPFHPATGVAGFRPLPPPPTVDSSSALPLIINAAVEAAAAAQQQQQQQQQAAFSSMGGAGAFVPKSSAGGGGGGGLPMESIGQSGCNCKKSRCLKLYCQCFAALVMCGPTCNCLQCLNLPVHEGVRQDAIRAITDRNPHAFQSKFRPDMSSLEAVHKLGCKCRKSACLKKYCECFNMGARCTDKCICVGCQNRAGVGRTFEEPSNSALTAASHLNLLMSQAQLGQLSNPPGSRPPSAPPLGLSSISPSNRSQGGKAKKRRTSSAASADDYGADFDSVSLRGSRHDEDDTEDMLRAAEDLALLKAGPVTKVSSRTGPDEQAPGGGQPPGKDASGKSGGGGGGTKSGSTSSAAFVRPSILRSKNKRSFDSGGLPSASNSSDDANSAAVFDSITSSSTASTLLEDQSRG